MRPHELVILIPILAGLLIVAVNFRHIRRLLESGSGKKEREIESLKKRVEQLEQEQQKKDGASSE